MSPWLLNTYMGAVMKEVKMRMGRRGESWDCLGSCMQTTLFCVVSRRKTRGQWWEVLLVCRRCLKANAGKSKGMMLNGEEGIEYEIRLDRM